MKKVCSFLFMTMVLLSAALAAAQSNEFDAPWKDPHVAIVIDPYEGNSIDWTALATDSRVVGIIHRATIGLRTDTKYADRKTQATGRGYKWGSYHLGKPGNPIAQADFYLEAVSPTADEVMALDIESLDPAKDMTLANAVRFIQRIREKTGRYPMLYANQAVVRQISVTYHRDGVFAKTPLWYARFKSRVTDFPTNTWDSYTLWQFSSEINCTPNHTAQCLYRAPGTKTDMDVNVYRGTIDELKADWPFKRE